MKIFLKDGKMNFVDENNVFVGYDYEQSCCEQFSYEFEGVREDQLDGYVFDPEYMRDDSSEADDDDDRDACTVRFRLTKGGAEGFLILSNYHNGYYSHGFTMERTSPNGNEILHEGSL